VAIGATVFAQGLLGRTDIMGQRPGNCSGSRMLASFEFSILIQAKNLTGSNVTEFSRRVGFA